METTMALSVTGHSYKHWNISDNLTMKLDRKKIIAFIDTTFPVVKRKSEKKKSGLYGIRTL